MNIAERFEKIAEKIPNNKAIVYSKHVGVKYKYPSLTFKELSQNSNTIAYYLNQLGIKKGTKTLLFIRPSLNFAATVFALFKIGAVPVLIDPGMGKKNLLTAIKEVEPDALIAEPIIHRLAKIYKDTFKSIKIKVSSKQMLFSKVTSIKHILKLQPQKYSTENVHPYDLAAILFTSGGTGTPKGVQYTHEIFDTQSLMLGELFSLKPGEVDIPGFPLFSLFALSLGLTSAIPDMDASRPGRSNPKKLIQNIKDNNGTFLAGSPAIWERVVDYAIDHGITLPSVKQLVMFGAPISIELHEKFTKVLTNGTTYTPYGATESLPVACISGQEILKHQKIKMHHGHGTCVGKIAHGVSVKIIKIKDHPIADISEIEELEINEVGEIIVEGKIVTPKYFNRPQSTIDSKIYETTPEGHIKIWHRIGDMGYFDEDKMLWFCGRKTHRVDLKNGRKTPIQCEAIFNRHPEVKRTALVKRNSESAALFVERKDHKILKGEKKKVFFEELSHMAKNYEHTKDINFFIMHKGFPVDIRHNIKIDRIKLTRELK